KKNHPVPFATGAWGEKDTNPAKPLTLTQPKPFAKSAAVTAK
ncbi:hypothetical protein FHS22_007504, partial [Planomonospora venezuelensis]|nr:hypothetical protein [Planomonospora venezuelensis]